MGEIGGNGLILVNSATIDANSAVEPLIINNEIFATDTNAGVLEATAGGSGGLQIFDNIANSKTIAAVGTNAIVQIGSAATISNTSTSQVLALGSGAQVQLDTATISGGRLRTLGVKAIIAAAADTTDAVVGGTIVSKSVVDLLSGSTLTLSGGTIGVGAIVETGSSSTLIVTGTLINSGLLEGIGGGNVILDGTVIQSLAGAILASGSGVHVESRPGRDFRRQAGDERRQRRN